MEKNKDELANTVTPANLKPETEITNLENYTFRVATGKDQQPAEQQAAVTNKISDNPGKAEVITNQPAEVETAEQTAEEESAAIENKALITNQKSEQQ